MCENSVAPKAVADHENHLRRQARLKLYQERYPEEGRSARMVWYFNFLFLRGVEERLFKLSACGKNLSSRGTNDALLEEECQALSIYLNHGRGTYENSSRLWFWWQVDDQKALRNTPKSSGPLVS